MAAAKRHTVVLTADGDVYTWGHKVVTPKRVQLAGTLLDPLMHPYLTQDPVNPDERLLQSSCTLLQQLTINLPQSTQMGPCWLLDSRSGCSK